MDAIKKLRNDAAQYGLLSDGTYSANIGYKDKLDDGSLDIERIRKDIESSKVDGHYDNRPNHFKYEPLEWWQIGKRILQFFAPDTKKEWVAKLQPTITHYSEQSIEKVIAMLIHEHCSRYGYHEPIYISYMEKLKKG